MSPAACIELIAASHAEDAAPLAPRARPPEMAPRRSLAGPAAAFGRDPRARASACPGEPALGLSPDLRRAGPSWRQFLQQQATSIVACDFFTVESLLLRRYYVLFFIEHGSRRVHLGGCTANPQGNWVTQQARNLGLFFAEQRIRFLIRDRDSKYTGPFDEIFRSERIRILRTPIRAPKANAVAERFVRTVRAECLDWLLILNRRHLERVLRTYVQHYNAARPHRALDLRPPDAPDTLSRPAEGEIRRRDKLGGLLHEYYRVAA